MAEHLYFNAIFIILQQTAVRRPWELGAGSIWFYGSRSFYATSSGMLNGMAVCLMNRFKTQVSPRGCAISSFLSSIYAEEIMCNNNSFPPGDPGDRRHSRSESKGKYTVADWTLFYPSDCLTKPHPPPSTHPPPVRIVSLVFLCHAGWTLFTPIFLQRQQLGECDVNSNAH